MKKETKMKFRYAIIYVPDVEAAIDFYKKAFGFQLKFMPESKLYGELDTGATSLAFVAEKMAEMHRLLFGVELINIK